MIKATCIIARTCSLTTAALLFAANAPAQQDAITGAVRVATPVLSPPADIYTTNPNVTRELFSQDVTVGTGPFEV